MNLPFLGLFMAQVIFLEGDFIRQLSKKSYSLPGGIAEHIVDAGLGKQEYRDIVLDILKKFFDFPLGLFDLCILLVRHI